jgi:hypothetical protein
VIDDDTLFLVIAGGREQRDRYGAYCWPLDEAEAIATTLGSTPITIRPYVFARSARLPGADFTHPHREA